MDNRLNWKLIFSLSLFGVGMGVAGLFGFTRGVELALWMLIFVVYARVIVQSAPGRYFTHAWLVSVTNGVWVGLIHSIFFPVYMRHNLDEMSSFASPLPLRSLLMIVGPILGALMGLIAGLFAFIAGKFMKKNPLT